MISLIGLAISAKLYKLGEYLHLGLNLFYFFLLRHLLDEIFSFISAFIIQNFKLRLIDIFTY